MKTGGTMNFLQRAGAIFMLLAIFASSCNKYADDFTQINTKLDALATQVAGVTTLTTDIAALKSQITALQTSVAALPTATAQTAQFAGVSTALTAMDAKITALTTTLNTVAASGTATKAVVDGLKTDLAALAATVAANNTAAVTAATNAMAKLTTNETAVAALKTKLDAMATDAAALAADVANIKAGVAVNTTAIAANADALTAQALQITTLAADLATFATASGAADAANATAAADAATSAAATASSLADIVTSLATLTTAQGDQATAAAVAALQVAVDAQKVQLDQIVANTSMYTGAVSIVTDTDVDFFMLKIAQMNVINGNLSVNPTLITKTVDLATILSKITSVVGGSAVTLTAVQAKPIVLNNLTSISGTLTVTGAALIDQTAVDISKLTTVSGNMAYSLDGAISLPLLSSVGGTFTFTSYIKTGTTILGTVGVNLPLLTSVGNVIIAGAGNLNDALSVVMPATGLAAISATSATTVTVVNTATVVAGFTVTPKSTATVDLSGITSAAGNLTVATGTTVNLSKLATMTAGGALSVTTVSAGTVNLDLWNSNNAVTIVGAKTVSCPVWVGGAASVLTAAAAETVSLPAFKWLAVPVLAAVKSLTVGNVNAPVNLAPYTTLTTVNLTGMTVTTWATLLATVVSTPANVALASVTLGGMWKSAVITDNGSLAGAAAKLTTLATSGVINSFTLSDADNSGLTAVTLGHTAFTSLVDGTPGALIDINDCANITSVTAASLDKVYSMNIATNAKLATLNFTGLANLANTGAGSAGNWVITGNALRGAYSPALAGPPYSEAVITSAELLKLKTYIMAASGATGYAANVFNLTWDKDLDGTGPIATLAAQMAANAAVSIPVDAVGAIDQRVELALVQ